MRKQVPIFKLVLKGVVTVVALLAVMATSPPAEIMSIDSEIRGSFEVVSGSPTAFEVEIPLPEPESEDSWVEFEFSYELVFYEQDAVAPVTVTVLHDGTPLPQRGQRYGCRCTGTATVEVETDSRLATIDWEATASWFAWEDKRPDVPFDLQVSNKPGRLVNVLATGVQDSQSMTYLTFDVPARDGELSASGADETKIFLRRLPGAVFGEAIAPDGTRVQLPGAGVIEPLPPGPPCDAGTCRWNTSILQDPPGAPNWDRRSKQSWELVSLGEAQISVEQLVMQPMAASASTTTRLEVGAETGGIDQKGPKITVRVRVDDPDHHFVGNGPLLWLEFDVGEGPFVRINVEKVSGDRPEHSGPSVGRSTMRRDESGWTSEFQVRGESEDVGIRTLEIQASLTAFLTPGAPHSVPVVTIEVVS